MRIIHLVNTLDPSAGGPASVAIRLAAAQAALGHSVAIISRDDGAARERSAVEWQGIPGVERVELITYKAGQFLAFAWRILPGLLTGTSVDFLHLHGVWEPLLLAAASICRRHEVPYAVLPHGMLDPWSLRQKPLKKMVMLTLIYKRMLNGAAFLHVLTGDEISMLRPLGLTSPTVLIPNGVFLEEIDQQIRPQIGMGEWQGLGGRPYILFLSRLHYKKGLDLLGSAFARVCSAVPDIQLVVAGPDFGARAEFEAHVKALSMQDRVHIVGPLYGASKRAALQGATCLCLPSRQEGFSLALLEAMAYGLPVVISQHCHFPEVAHAGAGEVTDLEPTNIAAALTRITANPGLRKEMGRRARALIEEGYIWPKIARRALGEYERHLGAKSTLRPLGKAKRAG